MLRIIVEIVSWSTVCVKHFFLNKRLTQREYNKQDNERRKEMANLMVMLATMLMAVCAGIKIL